MTDNCGIYCIANTLNGNKYIGSALNIGRRWSQHTNRLNKNCHHSIHLQRAWNKYGAECFEFLVIEQCDKFSLIEREQFYMDTLCPEYNMYPIAGSPLGYKHTDETKRKVSEAHKGITCALGYKHTAETCAKMSESKKGDKNHNFGKPSTTLGMHHSEETRRKMSESKKRYYAEKKAIEIPVLPSQL